VLHVTRPATGGHITIPIGVVCTALWQRLDLGTGGGCGAVSAASTGCGCTPLDHVRAAVRRGRAGVPAPPGPPDCSAPAPTPHSRPKTASPPSGRGSLTACYSPTGRIPTDAGEDVGDAAGDSEHTLVTRSAVTTSRWTRRLQAAGLVDVAADAYFSITGAACSELERATVEHVRARLVASGIASDCRAPASGWKCDATLLSVLSQQQ
jgi:hypothetical protein